ncbi:MAG: glycosyltransferase family 4 protein [Congregibacter sp.]
MVSLAGLAALLVSVVLTRFYLSVAKRLQLLDTPNARSAHSQATPSSGGIPIVAACLMVLVGANASGSTATPPNVLALLLLGSAVLCALGAWDDFKPLPVGIRMLVFLLVSLAAVLGFDPLLPGLGVFTLGLQVLAFAWLLNLYNFMDGIDGIAASQTVLVAGGLFAIGLLHGASLAFLVTAIVSAAAFAGFLLFNWSPARLFMGDSGSLCAGFLIGVLGMWGVQEGTVPAASWTLLMSPFLLDTGVTLLRRARHRERLTDGHSKHYYQRFMRYFSSHAAVVKSLILMQFFWLFPLSVLESFALAPAWTFTAVGLFPQLLLIVKYRHLK